MKHVYAGNKCCRYRKKWNNDRLILWLSPLLLVLHSSSSSSSSSERIRERNERILNRTERHRTARCFRRSVHPYAIPKFEAFCYVPDVCFSGGSNDDPKRTFYISKRAIERLSDDGTLTVFQDLWNYGNGNVVSEKDMERKFTRKRLVDGQARTLFLSTVTQGVAHYGPHTAFPLFGLLDPEIRSYFNLPRITHVWQLLFQQEQHLREAWVKDVVYSLERRFGVVTFSGGVGFNNVLGRGTNLGCFNAIMYDSRNIGANASRPFRVFALPSTTRRDFVRTIVTTTRTSEACAAPAAAARADSTSNVLRITLVQRRTKTRGAGVASRRWDNIEDVRVAANADAAELLAAASGPYDRLDVDVIHFEDLPSAGSQALAMRRSDVVVGVHGNGLTNVVFMRPCSALVEIFPSHFRYPLFQILARESEVVYASLDVKARSEEDGMPSCLLQSDEWRKTTPETCYRDPACRTCTREAPFVRVSYEKELRSRLIEAIRKRRECDLRRGDMATKKRSSVSVTTCDCRDGTFVVTDDADETKHIFYCDGPRLVRIPDWETCISIGSRCTNDAKKISANCLTSLAFSRETDRVYQVRESAGP